jgi:hypothetical protein
VFKKWFTLLFVFAFFSVEVNASTHEGLKAAFDEMNYSLSVEWNQEDKDFYEAQLKKFMGTLRELQKSGLTKDQMIVFAKGQVKDANIAKDLEIAFSMITINRMSSEEASLYMMESMKRAYAKGASWNGEVLIYLAVGLLVVALAVSIVTAANTGGSSNSSGSGGTYTCYDDCYYYDYSCGYDYYGRTVYCQGYTCDEVCY